MATLIQLPYSELEVLEKPEPHYGEVSVRQHWATFCEWAFDHGLRVNFHREPTGRELALGIAATPVANYHHTVILHYDRVYFNPASGWELPGGGVMSPVSQILYAITLDPKEQS